MVSIKYVSLVLITAISLAGCTKEIVEPFFHIAGEWEFVQLEYNSENGHKVVLDTLDYTIVFENCNDKKEDNPDRCNGEIKLVNETIAFDFLASPGSEDGEAINLSIPQVNTDQSSYSFEILGHYYVYYASYSGDTLTLITTDGPLVHSVTGEVLNNPRWIFIKK